MLELYKKKIVQSSFKQICNCDVTSVHEMQEHMDTKLKK